MATELESLLVLLDDKVLLLSLIVPFLVLALMVSLSKTVTGAIAARLHVILPVLAVAFVLAYVANAFHYVFYDGFYDHVEPSIVTIVRLLDRGQPVYHELTSASRYSLLYGPNTFIAPWLAVKVFGDSIVSIKLCCAFFTLGSLVLVHAVLRTSVASRLARQAGLIYFCGMSLYFWNMLVWVRSDSQMLFWVALGLFGATRRNGFVSAAVIGAAAGACLNAKLHGVFYFAPIIAVAMKRGGWKHWGVCAATASAVAAAPFLLIPEVSFANYLLWLKMATKHGLGAVPALQVFVKAGYLSMPLALAAVDRLGSLPLEERRKLLWANRARLILAVLGVGALMLAASKNGAGEWHLLPFLPLGAWFLAVLLDSGKAERASLSLGGVAGSAMAALLALGVINVALALRVASSVQDRSARDPWRAAVAEAREIAQRFPGRTVAIGYGSSPSPVTYARTELPLPTGFVLDSAALMDMRLSRLALPAATLDAFREGVVQVWLVPKGGDPFSMKGGYRGRDLFGKELQRVFGEHYKKKDAGTYFDVWCFDG